MREYCRISSDEAKSDGNFAFVGMTGSTPVSLTCGADKRRRTMKKGWFAGRRVSVGLTNILDRELRGREPAKGSHGKVVGAAVVDGKLLCKVIE